jgi:hypothetical protein
MQSGAAFILSDHIDALDCGKRKKAAYLDEYWRDMGGRLIDRAVFTSGPGAELIVFIDGSPSGRGPKVRLDVDSNEFAQLRVGGHLVAEYDDGRWHKLNRKGERKGLIIREIVIGYSDSLLAVAMPWDTTVTPGVRSRLSALA